jgi:hypothetical protein
LNRQAAAYWVARSRLRQGFAGLSVSGRRSLSEDGKPGDDSGNQPLSRSFTPDRMINPAGLAVSG